MATHWNETRRQWFHGWGHPSDGVSSDGPSVNRPRGLFEGDKILIAEDMPSIAWVLYDILTEAGYEVVGPVPTSDRAADLIADRRVDGALLDIGLADGPSFPVAELLVARGIPFAFLTGYDPEDIPLHLQNHLVISKPMNIATVLDAVKALCRPREADSVFMGPAAALG